MNEERIEQMLREWLATEADAAEMPSRVRNAAAAAGEMGGQRVARRRWPAWPRSVALVAATGVVLVAMLASVTLTGILPIGRPDCSGVTIERVRERVRDVAGYTWHMAGTELVHRLTGLDENRQPMFEYLTAPLEFRGAYEAPGSWQIDVVRGYDPDLVVPPSTGMLASDQWDGYLVANGEAWLRPRGATHFAPAGGAADLQLHRWANQLYGLLHGEPFLIEYESGFEWGSRLTWDLASVQNGCRLTGTDHLEAAPSGFAIVVGFVVDPETMLPVTASYRYVVPAQPAATAGEAGGLEEDKNLQFSYDYDNPPAVIAPVPAGFQPVDAQRAIADAQQLGVGDAPTMDQYQLGSAQAFLLHGPAATAALLYVDGRLAHSATVESTLDVWVTLLGSGEPDPATFLVGVINDPRVAYVEVFFTDGETRTIEGSGAHPQSVTSGEGLGEIVTWIPYDDAGNEISVEPPPP